MKVSSFDETQLYPLTTDAEIQERVETLIGRANMRQLWLLFLDELNLQLPLLVPIDGLPLTPNDEQTAEVMEHVREVMEEIGATSIVVVIERYGPAMLTAQDLQWAKSLRRGAEQHAITVRAQLLSHRTGVRWISGDDLS